MRAFASLLMLLVFIARARAADTLDITGYGAVANDGKDDSVAIEKAVSAAKPGDTIKVPPGVCDIASAVSLKSGVTLEGAGPESTTLHFIGSSLSALLVLNGVSDVTVSGLTLDANNSPSATQGISAENSRNLNLIKLAIKNLTATKEFGPHGVFFAANVTDSVIANCTFSNIAVTSQWGAAIRIAQGSSRNRIIDNTINNTGRGGILVNNDSTDLVIRGNTITGSGRSKGGEGLGIELWGGCHRSIVEDNRLDHWLSVDSSNNVAVRRNVISDKSGIYKWCGLELVNSHDCVFTDNTVDGGAKIGISLSGPGPKECVYFGHNIIKNCSTWGTQIQGETGKARHLYFYKNIFAGAKRQIPETLYPPQGHAVRFNGDCDHIVFDSNTIRDNEGDAFQIVGQNIASLRFINNDIRDNGRNNEPHSTLTQAARAKLVALAHAVTGEAVTFELQSDEQFDHVLWDFGSGIPMIGRQVSYKFENAGERRVSCIAWTANGIPCFNEMTLNVEPAK